MKLTLDTTAHTLTCECEGTTETLSLDSPQAFEHLSREWLRVGWYQKYSYTFTWMGRPVIQLPEDLLRIQEVIYDLRPDVILETGVAHGGSLVFYASLCKLLERGRVIGVDIEVRPHNRRALAEHPLANLITLVEGSSIDPATVARVRNVIKPGERVLVLLDSCHTKAHVLEELRAYAPLVSLHSYIVAADGIMATVAGGPRTKPEWAWDNPREAVAAYLREDPRFIGEDPPLLFNESPATPRVTYWPSAYLRRVA